MPGVPHEMQGIMKNEVLPLLKQHFQLPHIGHRTLLTAGVGESFLADKIKDFEFIKSLVFYLKNTKKKKLLFKDKLIFITHEKFSICASIY